MNKRGFTLVELLASLVILSILMTVAVSSVLRVVETNRQAQYVEDAKKFVAQVEYGIRGKKFPGFKKPTNEGGCIAISLKDIDTSDFKKAPSGGHYDIAYSFVVLQNSYGDDVYYVRLMESIDDKGFRGIYMSAVDDLKGGEGKDKVETKYASDLFTVNSSATSKIESALSETYANCNSITVYSND